MKLNLLFLALALAACTPPAADAPAQAAAAQQAEVGDCVAAAEMFPVQDAEQPSCDWAALAASAPEDSFVGSYSAAIPGVEGGLRIAQRDDGSYAVGVSTVSGSSLHMCGGAFDGRAEGETLALSSRDAAAQACTVQIARTGAAGEVIVQTEGDCTYYCGARARLDGVTFRRDSD